ncbi:hypothetical protein MOQ_000696 [Trypanosoma cruzi marinkellei]|uniref:WD repeat-containing protein 54 beta-propeller domain-containing protein n=1 Tax=Trypanosoma cruzi marinkellei TaxID=85056 RepID=K2NMU1_TRYCR|nr:hypothetical protein MOQ_000696 [Trypanosoma cruzi marinkellei]
MPRTFLSLEEHVLSGGVLPPSLLYNNLSFVEECEALVYASRKDCIVMDIKAKKTHVLPIGTSEKEMIVHCTATLAPIGLLHPGHSILILITTESATQLWAKESPLGLVPHNGSNGNGCCGAIVSSPTGVAHILVSTNKGVVIFAEFDATPNTPFRVQSAVKGHMEHAVTAARLNPFHDSPLFAVTGDSVGRLLFWDREKQPFAFFETSECVTALQIVSGGDFAVAANGAGKLQVFDSRTGEVRVEICAHSRWINTMAFCPATNTVISGAEDGYLTVWSMPKNTVDGVTLVEPIATQHVPNVLPTGAAFRADGTQVFIAMYDTNRITEYVLV